MCVSPSKCDEARLASGISYIEFSKSWNNRKPVRVHVLKVPLQDGIIVKAALARNAIGRLQTTSRIAYNNNAIAAINGMFFDRTWPYLPVGLLVIDGKIITKSLLNRSAIGISSNSHVKFGIPKFMGYVVNLSTNEKIPIWGINRPRKENEVIIYTPEYGWRTKTNSAGIELIVEENMVVGLSDGNSPIPRNGYVISYHGWTVNYTNALPPGAPIEAKYKLSEGWENFEQVFTGGPRLLENGKIVAAESIDQENFSGEISGRNARTAIGVRNNNELMLIVVEGKKSRYRRRKKQGASYMELAQLMKDLGAKDAIGLDGGGSSTMYLNGSVVSRSQNGSQQSVSNAIIIRIKPRNEASSLLF